MATYKVIQDIEAEDKFVGPLTLKQFVFACAGVLFGYLNIFALTRGVPLLMAIFMPPMLLGFFLAIPWSRDQPTEMWVLARIRFMFKSKKRIWNQTGVQELVTITAPKREEKNLTKSYTEGEVKSRLKALAETIDSRGWAIKHATLEDSQLTSESLISDRLVDPSVLPKEVPPVDLASVPDVLDPVSSPLSSHLDNMIKARGDRQKNELMDKMDRARRGEPLESIQNENIAISHSAAHDKKVAPAGVDEQLIAQELKAKRQAGVLSSGNMRSIRISHNKNELANESWDSRSRSLGLSPFDFNKAQAAMTSGPTPDTIRLARSNDLNVETVAREANRGKEKDGEVEVSLH